MHINKDIRLTVVFIGFGKGGNFEPAGTGFLVAHDDCKYLVTAKHIAISIGDSPFELRLNLVGGGTETVSIDPLQGFHWNFHDDANVDAAVCWFHYNLRRYDHRILPSGGFANDMAIASEPIGIGDLTYTIGLFRLFYGSNRNLPVLHSGTLSLMAGEERIRVQDWDDPAKQGRKLIEAFLVEQQSLKGLSGAPVLVRPSMEMVNMPSPTGKLDAVFPQSKVMLLGLWQGSWDARPDEVVAFSQGQPIRVPVGMGVVVPSQNILEILDSKEAKSRRDEWRKRNQIDQTASPDSILSEADNDSVREKGDKVLKRMLDTPPNPHES